MTLFWPFGSSPKNTSQEGDKSTSFSPKAPNDSSSFVAKPPKFNLSSSVHAPKSTNTKAIASNITSRSSVFKTDIKKRLSLNLNKSCKPERPLSSSPVAANCLASNNINTSSPPDKEEEEDSSKSLDGKKLSNERLERPSSWYGYFFGKRDASSEDYHPEPQNINKSTNINKGVFKNAYETHIVNSLASHSKVSIFRNVHKQLHFAQTQKLIKHDDVTVPEEDNNSISSSKQKHDVERKISELNPNSSKVSVSSKAKSYSILNPNLVLPTFDTNFDFRYVSIQPSYGLFDYYCKKFIGIIGKHISGSQKKSKYNQIAHKRVEKAVVIGIHGWFPLKIYQKVLGEPTGTSKKFCQMTKKALKEYVIKHCGYMLHDDAILQINLEGEGTIEYRVDKLYSSLTSNSSWILALEEADTVIFATHSQGVPVSVLLIEKLMRIDMFAANDHTSVLILAMAGITHGPFKFLKENVLIKYLEAKPAHELFSFLNPETTLYKKFVKSMQFILAKGVLVCAVASMMDQVVPIHSGIMHGFEHPAIIRAIYIDSCDYKPDFISSLLSFCMLLRNYGLKDHDLIVYLSEVVLGSLYSGTQGHSTIYEELKVYEYGIQWLMSNSFLKRKKFHASSTLVYKPVHSTQKLNMYYLPWILKSIVDDESIKNNTYVFSELKNIIELFKSWDPSSKPLKDLKVKLEPLKSSL